jgi:hypothetical protein
MRILVTETRDSAALAGASSSNGLTVRPSGPQLITSPISEKATRASSSMIRSWRAKVFAINCFA